MILTDCLEDGMKRTVLIGLVAVITFTSSLSFAGEFTFAGKVDSKTYVWKIHDGKGNEYVWMPVGYLGYSYAVPDHMSVFILNPKAVSGTWPWTTGPIGWAPAAPAQVRIWEGEVFIRVAVCKEGQWPKKCMSTSGWEVANYKITVTMPD